MKFLFEISSDTSFYAKIAFTMEDIQIIKPKLSLKTKFGYYRCPLLTLLKHAVIVSYVDVANNPEWSKSTDKYLLSE